MTYRCMNCKYVFEEPVKKDNPNVPEEQRTALRTGFERTKYVLDCCPKCGSDALEEVVEE